MKTKEVYMCEYCEEQYSDKKHCETCETVCKLDNDLEHQGLDGIAESLTDLDHKNREILFEFITLRNTNDVQD